MANKHETYKLKVQLKKAQLDKDWNGIKRIFDKINDICKEEADMNIFEFLKYKDDTLELCRYYSIGPYKSKTARQRLDLLDFKNKIERTYY